MHINIYRNIDIYIKYIYGTFFSLGKGSLGRLRRWHDLLIINLKLETYCNGEDGGLNNESSSPRTACAMRQFIYEVAHCAVTTQNYRGCVKIYST